MAVSGTLERTLRAAYTAATKGISTAIEGIVDEVAEDARDDWYDQVDKRSGDSQESITSEMRITTDKVTGVVYATEKKTYMIKRPGPLSVKSSRKLSDPAEYWRVRDHYRQSKQMPVGYTFARLDENGDPIGVRKIRPNPKASDGKNMWLENVKKLGKKRINQQISTIRKATKKAVQEATRG